MTPLSGRIIAAITGIIIVGIAAVLQQQKALGLSDQAGAILVVATAVLTAIANVLPSIFGVEVTTKPTSPTP